MLAQFSGRLGRRLLVLLSFAAVSTLLLFHLFRSSYYAYTHAVKVGSIRYVPSSYDWGKAPVFHPLDAANVKSPPSGTPQRLPLVQYRPSSADPSASGPKAELRASQRTLARSRKAAVRAAFVKSWEAYKAHAWRHDELQPLSGTSKKSFGWGAQLIDALDTLWIMDAKYDFYKAVEVVAVIDWGRAHDSHIDVFEVTIRHLGGLLAAFELSQEPALLAKAMELGDMLYAAFDTPNRMPTHTLSFDRARNGRQSAEELTSGAGGCSMGLEFTRLSQLTGDPKYYDAAERVKQFLLDTQNSTLIPGLWPHDMNFATKKAEATMFTLGAGADSLYEYLPKMHALLGGLDQDYPKMAVWALETAPKHLIFKPVNPNDTDVLMAGNVVVSRVPDAEPELASEMQHLTCFAGGMYALAARLFERDDFLALASRLTRGCVYAYDVFPTGIMPEISTAWPCKSIDGPCHFADHSFASTPDLPGGFVRVRDPRYLLRPEAIESIFYMWRITGDEVWRDAAWRMWEAIVRETETDLAFASITNVLERGSDKDNTMETFWMSETLKYFYLIFDDESNLDLDDWVFNTEAHPLRRPKPETA